MAFENPAAVVRSVELDIHELDVSDLLHRYCRAKRPVPPWAMTTLPASAVTVNEIWEFLAWHITVATYGLMFGMFGELFAWDQNLGVS